MYRLIYKPTSNCIEHYDTWREAQEIAGKLIDDRIDENYIIAHYIKDTLQDVYELKDFVSRTQPDNFTLDLPKGKKPGKDLERERFHHLDDKETAEVLKYTPTGTLIGELVRRSHEYESFVADLADKLHSLKIYDIKH